MTSFLRGAIWLLGAAAMLAASATSAVAGTGYGNGGVRGGQAAGGGGTLPFTGSDLALYVVIGVATIASGLALRGYSSRRLRRPD
jgi:hypothetical protein